MTQEALLDQIKESHRENEKLRKENESLKGQLASVLKLLNGFKSERFVGASAAQLELFSSLTATSEPEIPTQSISYTREKKQHPGRHALPEHLPVEEIIIEPEEDTTGMKKIGEEISETLSYTPASLVKIRRIRPKYAKADADGVCIADLPTRPIDKCIAESSLLAYILVSKFVDHLPFYRQIQRFSREYQWKPAASTLSDWMGATCSLLEPLYNTLKQKILESDYLQADESPIKVLESENKGSTHRGYHWVYHDPIRKLVAFDYRKGRGQHGPKEFLQDFEGYLQCDGYTVYDKIGTRQEITLVGCLAHVRRKFHDSKINDLERAEKALAKIQAIYILQRGIAAMPQEQQQTIRQSRLLPLFEDIKTWIEQEALVVMPKSAIGKAMNYYLNQYPKLIAIAEDARLTLDNNQIENTIRPMALGRKNYLFAGSHKAAQNAAMLYSFFGSCKRQGIDPYKWLNSTLERIPKHSIQKLEQLLPGYQEKITV